MSQDDDELQRAAEVLHGVFQTAEHLASQTIACHANDEQIVRAFVENQFDRHAGIRAAQHDGKRALLQRPGLVRQQPEVARIDRDDLLDFPALVVDVVEQRGEAPVAFIQPSSAVRLSGGSILPAYPAPHTDR